MIILASDEPKLWILRQPDRFELLGPPVLGTELEIGKTTLTLVDFEPCTAPDVKSDYKFHWMGICHICKDVIKGVTYRVVPPCVPPHQGCSTPKRRGRR